MLPCDARVHTAIDEVSRASDARFQALTIYWKDIEQRSKDQSEAVRKLLAGNDVHVEDWKADRADSEQEQTRVGAQAADLREAARQQAALAAAARVLNGIAQSMAAAVKQGAAREEAAAKLDEELSELIAATQARQSAIEDELKALTTESVRWNAYYAARITRAQMECSITGPPQDATPASRTKKGTK